MWHTSRGGATPGEPGHSPGLNQYFFSYFTQPNSPIIHSIFFSVAKVKIFFEEAKMELNSTRVIHHAQGVQKRTTQKKYKVKCL